MVGCFSLRGLCSCHVSGELGRADARPGFRKAVLAVAYFCLDVSRGDGLGAHVLLYPRLELTLVHRLQQGRLIGQLQGPH